MGPVLGCPWRSEFLVVALRVQGEFNTVCVLSDAMLLLGAICAPTRSVTRDRLHHRIEVSVTLRLRLLNVPGLVQSQLVSEILFLAGAR